MSLVILTRTPENSLFSTGTYKNALRVLLGKFRGPQAVMSSALRGFKELGKDYKYNPKAKEIADGDTVWVNQSVDALAWAIKTKTEGKKIKIVAGPNLVVLPQENDRIICNEQIDVILQPSEWTRKLYETHEPSLAPRLRVWSAGVSDPYKNGVQPAKENFFIIYQKNAPEELFNEVKIDLASKGIPFKVIQYGSFKHSDFLSLLNKASGVIFLSTSESQGLALQEAWIRNVPTLVWDRGFWEYKGETFEHEKISCPLLTEQSGMTFKDQFDFSQKLNNFVTNLKQFDARTYCLENLVDKVTTARYLDIITS